MSQNTSLGIYIHVPFCGKKCPYCDFYSAPAKKSLLDAYTQKMLQVIEDYREKHLQADTLYFGGGTPNLLGAERLTALISKAKAVFSLPPEGEVTVECNPATTTVALLQALYTAGCNRLSFGVQSFHQEELTFLGRKHTPLQAEEIISTAHTIGFSNISLDLMAALPNQREQQVLESVQRATALPITHVSCYLLKIEEGTPFFHQRESFTLPEDEETAQLYLAMANALEQSGFFQYEISNFAKEGYQGRHNLHYWHCEEYLGLGPSAHSFFEGKRFYQAPSLADFLQNKPPVQDGIGGEEAECFMLQLRLTEGISDKLWRERFQKPLPSGLWQKAKVLSSHGLLTVQGDTIALTKEGFLVSNGVIGTLLEKVF